MQSDIMDISVNYRLMGCEILPVLAELASFCSTSLCHRTSPEEHSLLIVDFISLIVFWQFERLCFVRFDILMAVM
jgi:hypothetical protein